MASYGGSASSQNVLIQQHHPQMAHITPPIFNNEDYDPFEMRDEDEIHISPPQYPQATKAPSPSPSPSTHPTAQREVITTSREVTGLDTPAHHDWLHLGKTPTWHEKVNQNFRKRYRGNWTFFHLRRVFLPRQPQHLDPEAVAQKQTHDYDEAHSWSEPEGHVVKNAEGKYEYRNEFHQIDRKYVDTAVYLSPTNYVPRRLVVQTTDERLREIEAGADTGDWIRTRIQGNVPTILKVSEWALRPLDKGRWWNKLDAGLRMLMVSFPLQVMLALPGFSGYDDDETADSYTDHPGYHCEFVLSSSPPPPSPSKFKSHTRFLFSRPLRCVC